jgi:N-methylhydantoinase B/oxoprolinase/acetone carboxylase alpha subunit
MEEVAAAMERQEERLDPVTFEVLKNAFVNLVDQMSEQILKTCYSFVIYCRDFSNALCDARGNTVMQGSQDIAVHVGTLHFTARAVLDAFADDVHPGDVYLMNDPYLGGTHFCDVRVIRPVFVDGELIALLQSNGHWADVGGSVPGSFNILARDHYGEGMRIPPVKVWDRGIYRKDVANLLAANMRRPCSASAYRSSHSRDRKGFVPSSPRSTSSSRTRAVRGGCGVEKGGVLMQAERAVISYCCDRSRSVTWGILGGLPSIPHGAWLNPGKETERYLGAVFSGVPIRPGDSFTRPSAGGGGLGDPLERDPQRVLEDVVDGYVSVERAKKDYGVVVQPIDPEVCQYEVDLEATRRERDWIREQRLAWLDEDPESVRERLLRSEIDVLDAIRRHGVIFDWGTKTVLPKTTEQFRSMLRHRAAAYWDENEARNG